MCNIISILFVIFVTNLSLNSVQYNNQQKRALNEFLTKINNRE